MGKPFLLSLFVAFLLGLWSLFLGQDRNFDLANYHLYNAYAFINNKLDQDFAAAALQTYLNPLLDVPYYLMSTHFKPQFAGFLMGLMQGLAFLFILLIAKQYQDKLIQKKQFIIFAFAGILTPQYLAQLGNTMGDNITSIFNLASLSLIIIGINQSRDQIIPIKYVIFSGLLIGLSTGLKLTNGPLALASAITFLLIDPKNNIKNSIYFSFFVLLGIFIAGGFWFLKMWSTWHNPVFPFYGNIFPNEFINSNFFSNDPSGQKKIWESLLWPFISSFNAIKAGRGALHQLYCPTIYILFISILIIKIQSFYTQKNKLFINKKEKFLILFSLLSYVISIKVFNVERYLISIELIAPLLTYICLKQLTRKELAWKCSKKILFIFTLIILLDGSGKLGHSAWSSKSFNAQIPEISAPKETAVLMTDDVTSPVSWIVTLFPKEISFIRIGIFPNDKNIINSRIQKKQGQKYAFFSGFYNWRQDNVKKWSKVFSFMGFLSTKESCGSLQKFIDKIHFRGQIIMNEDSSNDVCFIGLHPKDKFNEKDQNLILINNAKIKLENAGFTLNESSCEVKEASIGDQNWRYIWCKLR